MELFLYGSLKRGGSNVARLGDSAFRREAVTFPRFRLYDYGGYPALVLAEPGQKGRSIQGEVWEVEAKTLKELDLFEGLPQGLYRRDPIQLLDESEGVEAYFYARGIEGKPDCGDRWLEGHAYWQEGWRFR